MFAAIVITNCASNSIAVDNNVQNIPQLESAHISVVFNGSMIDASHIEIVNNNIIISGLTNIGGESVNAGSINLTPDGYTVIPTNTVIPNPAGTDEVSIELPPIKIHAAGNTNEYTITVLFSAYVSLVKPTHIIAIFNDITAAVNNIQISGDSITISGFTNVGSSAGAGRIQFNPDRYTVSPDIIVIPNPAGIGEVSVKLSPVKVIVDGTTNEHTITILFSAYVSPVRSTDITAMLGGVTAAADNIEISGTNITVSGFTNIGDMPATSGMLTFDLPASAIYSVTPESLEIPNPLGLGATNIKLAPVMVNSFIDRIITPHQVIVNFSNYTTDSLLEIISTNVKDSPTNINIRGIIVITESCQFLAAPVLRVDGTPYTATPPLPMYFDRERDRLSDNKYHVTQELTLIDGSQSIPFVVTIQFPNCESLTAAGITGTGSQADPYQITNAIQLELISYLITTDNAIYGDKFYTLTNDIDLGLPKVPWSKTSSLLSGRGLLTMGSEEFSVGTGFPPIGTSNNPFSGRFDCESNTISNLYINRTDPSLTNSFSNAVGLFGIASNATIENCFLSDVEIAGTIFAGGIVGDNYRGTLTKSYTTGIVKGTRRVGGLMGRNSGMITKSYSTVAVTGTDDVGGLVGQLSGLISEKNSSIVDSYASGTITGARNVGGLVGTSFYGNVTNSYAFGMVTGTTRVGGLVGLQIGFRPRPIPGNPGNPLGITNGTIVNSYYAGGNVSGTVQIGGLLGSNQNDLGTIQYSYWNTETSGQSISAGGTGRTTLQMQVAAPVTTPADVAVYVNWNKDSMGMDLPSADQIWNFTSGKYPRLKNVVCANRQDNSAATDCTSTLQ
ncbi:hypothetical protein COTS27_00845 [Spirochaetota bacterium]|nr:hypothetical protein COTS27_00845 [Spirochaetota bacterium]